MGRVIFEAYSRQQIEQIVSARLSGLGVFSTDAIEICARKVASVSGDVRRALQICRRAAKICEAGNNPGGTVTIENINTAAKELSSSLHTSAIAAASLFEKIFLIACYKQTVTNDSDDLKYTAVWNRFKTLANRLKLARLPSKGETMFLCQRLGSTKLLITEQRHDERAPRICLGVEPDDIKFALRNDAQVASLVA